jgi:nicotinamidase/pyrazinamidase
MAPKPKVLILIDVQNDFCPGGALAVGGGDEIVPLINAISGRFERVVATQDWHPKNQVSFASNHAGKKPFDQVTIDGYAQTLWPDHCVQGTPGADFHPALSTVPVDLIVRKGTHPAVDSYSVFLENDKKTKTGLDGYLTSLGAGEIFLCGLATDYCVFYSAMDAVKFGFTAAVIIDACRGIDAPPGSVDKAVADMREAGVRIITAGEL